MRNAVTILLAAVIALTLAGCTESSLARRDTMTPFAYNTQASNIATQAVNPAGPGAFDRHIGLDGAYGDKAIAARLERAATVTPSGSSDSSPSTANASPQAAGDVSSGDL